MNANIRAVSRPASLALAAAMLLTFSAAACIAQTTSAIPATMDHRLATEPYISGTVSSVTSHMMVVNTTEGESVELAIDSRTLRPVDLDRGMNMRAEFRILENGQYYAERIVPIRGGSANGNDMAAATSNESSDNDTRVVAANYTSGGSTTNDANAQNAVPAAQNQGAPTTQDQSTTPATSPDASSDDATKKLPRTASEAPLLLLLGCVALMGAGILYVRRARSA